MRKLFILFMALFYMAPSFAADPVSGYYTTAKNPYTVFPTCKAACDDAFSTLSASSQGYYGGSASCNSSGNSCTTAANSRYWAVMRAPVCADGTTPTNGVCADPGPKCSTAAGGIERWTQARGTSKLGADNSDPGTSGPYPSSSPNCGLSSVPDVEECYSRPNADGKTQTFYCTYSGKSDGTNAPAASAPTADSGSSTATKTPATAVESADEQGNCPKGTVQAGMDSSGTPICMGTGTNPTSNSSSTAPTSTTTKGTDAAGNATETTTTKTTNADGSTTTTTTTTTTAPDGTKTVTGSTTTGAASNGAQGQQNDPADDFCVLHPELTACKNSSVAGSCGTISCTGDAIQCATLQQAAAMRCARDSDDAALKGSGAYALGQQALSGADPLKSSLPSVGNATGISVPSLDSSGWLGGGQCFPDKSFSLQGQTVTIPFSQACGILVALRYALMVAASLVAFKILRGAFLSE